MAVKVKPKLCPEPSGESGGGPPQSKTLAQCQRTLEPRKASWTAPVLWRFGKTSLSPGRAELIAPETPNALAPLIKDLESPEMYVRQQTIYTLGGLGTNGYEAVPALLKCLSHPDTQTRIDATRALAEIGIASDEYISALGMNLSCSNEYVFLETVETLANMAGHCKAAFFTLAKAGVSGNIRCPIYKDSPIFLLGQVMRTNTPDLLKGLENPDPQVRLGTLEVFNEFRFPIMRPHIVSEAVPKLRELADKDPDLKVRSRAADMLQFQSQ